MIKSYHKCGTAVITTLGQIDAIITGCTIRFDAVAYELSYFYGGEYRQIWMNENEFSPKGANRKMKIGFNKQVTN